MRRGVHPVILLAAAGVLVALVASVAAGRARHRLVALGLVVLALVSIAPTGFVLPAFHPELVDGRFRTYKAFYRDLQVGMTRAEVLAALEQRYPSDGPRLRPVIMDDSPQRLGFFMHPETATEPNCEGIFVTLEAGRVTRIVYSAD